MAVIIELLNSQGKSIGIHKFSQAEIRIGRSYDNDVILLDPHSCAEHAILSCDEQGQWQLRDLNSANGTLNSRGQRVAVVSISASGQELTLGKQRLRVFFSAAAVAPTRLLATGWHSLRLLSSIPLLVMLLVLLAANLAYDTWVGVLGEAAENWQRQLLAIPFLLLALLLWPALLALWARFRSHDAHFRQQATLVYAVAVFWLLWQISANWLGFNFSNTWILTVLQLLLPTLLLFCLFWYGFTLAGVQRKGVQWLLALVLTSTYWLVPYIQSAGPNLQPQYQAELLPQSFLITTPTSPDVFLAQTEALYQQAD